MSNLPFYFKYGYSTDINSTYAVVGNPSSYYLDSNFIGSGSIFVYKYNVNTDEFEYLNLIKKYYKPTGFFVLAADTSSLNETYLNADTSSTANGLNIELNYNTNSFYPISDGYGISTALSSSILVVGCPYYYYSFVSGSSVVEDTGSVEIYDLTSISTTNTITASSIIYNDITTDVNHTFGESVSIEGNTLVVGSSLANGTYGAAYIYTQSANVWSLYQTFTGTQAGHLYGGIVKIDPSGSKRIIVGHKSTSSFGVDVYDYNSSTSQWENSTTLVEDKSLTGSLNFIDYPPYIITSDSSSYYGHSISIYGNYIIVGAPNDMYYREYESSSIDRNRGAVYFYYKCADTTGWKLLNKSYGNDNILKTNNLGSTVSIFDEYAVAGNVKDVLYHSSSYITASLYKNTDCNPNDPEIDTLGQFAIYKLNTSSLYDPVWDLICVVNNKKKYGYPYSLFGYSLANQNKLISVGSPLFLSDPTSSIVSSSATTLHGVNYIYNIDELYSNYKVGDVFYRNGKFIFSNSGSIFDNLMKDKFNRNHPMYDITYKSQQTIYEKQILCRIEAGEFNYSTNPTSLIPNNFIYDIDHNRHFTFVDLDLICKYVSFKNVGTQNWTGSLDLTQSDIDWINYYNNKYNIRNNDPSYLSKYSNYLESIYTTFDVDGNKKIQMGDIYLLFKYFTDSLTKDVVFKYVDVKSQRKSIDTITSYLDQMTGKYGYGKINPEFFNFDYSSSLDKTGSYLAPFITTIGLYSGLDLVAVAKLGMPIKNTGELPLNILVKWDI